MTECTQHIKEGHPNMKRLQNCLHLSFLIMIHEAFVCGVAIWVQLHWSFAHWQSGGGSTQAQFSAAGALNLTAEQRLFNNHDGKGAYYPVVNTGNEERRFLCYGGHCNYWTTPRKSFEQTFDCNATTPIGLSVACPEKLKHGVYHAKDVIWRAGLATKSM